MAQMSTDNPGIDPKRAVLAECRELLEETSQLEARIGSLECLRLRCQTQKAHVYFGGELDRTSACSELLYVGATMTMLDLNEKLSAIADRLMAGGKRLEPFDTVQDMQVESIAIEPVDREEAEAAAAARPIAAEAACDEGEPKHLPMEPTDERRHD